MGLLASHLPFDVDFCSMPVRCLKTKTSPLPPTSRNLRDGERLLIARRRAGWTQAEASAKLRITRREIQLAESGRMAETRTADLLKGKPAVAALVRSVEAINDQEKCHLHRVRWGLTIPQVGKLIGYSKFWAGNMERDPEAAYDPLLDFWRQPSADIVKAIKTLG